MPSRKELFDSRRQLNKEKMSTPEDLRIQIQQLHILVERQEQQIQLQQQQIQQQQQQQQPQPINNCMLQLTTSQVLKKFGDIKTFYGREDYQL